MAEKNLLFRHYLRILTPEEINDLTSGTAGNTRVSLTDVLNSKLSGEEVDLFSNTDNLLQFKRSHEDVEEVVEEIKAGKNVIDAIDRFYIRINNEDTALDEMGREVETSTFILKEKERFAYSQKKLKGAEILKLYKKNLMVDIEQEKLIKDDLSKSTQSGILVNKKQA